MMNFEGIQDLGGASAQNETQAPEEKVVNLEEQKKKRQPFAYYIPGGLHCGNLDYLQRDH